MYTRSRKWSALSGILLMSLVTGCMVRTTDGTAITSGPYLENAGRYGITVRWTSDLASAGMVRWSPAGRPLDHKTKATAAAIHYARDVAMRRKELSEVPADAIDMARTYDARLTGLAPGTEYRYQVEFAGQKVEGSFRTFPDKPEPFTFVAFSDTHGADAVAAGFAAHQPAFLVNSGDLVDNEHYPEYCQFFSPAMNAVTRRIPMFVTRGNHDASGRVLSQLFTFPSGRLYYSFDYANAHFVCLDSCLWRWPNAETNIQAMLEWCEADLQASRADWKIVFFHEPPYDLSYRRTDWGRADAMPIFRRNGVDLIFCGHAHSYQRLGPLFWPGQNDQHPITLVISAGASTKYVAMPRRADPQLAVRSGRGNYVVCRVDGSKLRFRALTGEGQEIDSLEISKTDGRLDPAYIARAMPEETFGLIEHSLAELWVSQAEIASGEEFSIDLLLRAGSEPFDFEIHPADDSMQVVELVAPVKGTVSAREQTPVTVRLRAKMAIRKQAKGNRTDPVFALECRYQADGRTGAISSELARVK